MKKSFSQKSVEAHNLSENRYEIKIEKKAIKKLEKIPQKDQKKIREKISSLEINPRPPESKKLKGYERAYRLRHRDYRIVYEINDREVYILVFKVAHREGIYRQISQLVEPKI